MAKANNVSIATLRLYDEMGLIKPIYIETEIPTIGITT